MRENTKTSKVNILLNGATGGTNFGDYLFAEIFQNFVEDIVGKENVYWYEARYQMSDFFRKHLGYSKKYNLKEIDALVCISGGYFCGNDKTIRDYFIRYWRYFRICLKCIRKNIPVAIIGLDVAKSKNALIDKIQKYILSNAKVVAVRNKESISQLEKYGINTGVLTADTAHTILTTLNISNSQKESDASERKALFFHVQISALNEIYRLIPALNSFLNSHPEYDVYVGTDQYCYKEDVLYKIAENIKAPKVEVLHYDYPVDLCKTLSKMDLVITPKLHVGIVSATFSKSVVSFSVHSEKIKRFYEQLSARERTMAMSDFSELKAVEMLEKFHNVPLIIPDEILKAAHQNLDELKNFLDNLKEELHEN